MIKLMPTTVSTLCYNGLINTIMKTVEKENHNDITINNTLEEEKDKKIDDNHNASRYRDRTPLGYEYQ